MGRRLILKRELPWRGPLWPLLASCCISPPFGGLSTTRGLMTYVLLTRAPLYWGRSPFSLDLHVLGAPLTFVLSQDQTLQLNLFPDCSGDTQSQPAGKPEGFHLESVATRNRPKSLRCKPPLSFSQPASPPVEERPLRRLILLCSSSHSLTGKGASGLLTHDIYRGK